MKTALLIIATAMSTALGAERLYAVSLSPEKETLEISKLLKPIPDSTWTTIAGARLSENYTIVKGDTLYDISNRLFGDPRYWPKIWALNNNTITNPHLIRPKNIITFSGGTGESLPSVNLAEESDLGTNAVRTDTVRTQDAGSERNETTEPVLDSPSHYRYRPKKTSKDWKRFPRQPWEQFSIILPEGVDKDGFDRKNKVIFNIIKGFELDAISATEKLNPLAGIVAARELGYNLGVGDTVYIRADGDLQVGDIYTITKDPALLKSENSDRAGFAYSILGRVKIVSTREGLFVGEIVWARDTIQRGSLIIPTIPRYTEPPLIPGETAVHGIVLTSTDITSKTIAQGATAFVDRGEEDGIKPGMVFRVYQHYDPGVDKKITSGNYIIDADLVVTHTSPRFSTVTVLRSRVPIREDVEAILLTDVSDLQKILGVREQGLESTTHGNDLDELDQLDDKGGLGKEEERELKQLEKWVEKPAPVPTPSESPQPVTSPIPEEPPPPPEPVSTAEPQPTPSTEPPPPTVDFPGIEPPPPAPETSVPPSDAPPPTNDSQSLDKLLNQ